MPELPEVSAAGVVLRALLAVLVPFGVAWWTGRRMIRLAAAEDPLLPELLLARQRQVLVADVSVFVVLTVLLDAHIVWVGVLVVAGSLLGSYPLRRQLFELRLGPGTALRRGFAAIVASLGLWILLAWTPALVLEAAPAVARLLGLAPWQGAAAAGAAIGVALLAWGRFYREIWIGLQGARPITDAALLARFSEIARRAGLAMPAVYRIGEGSHVVNAFALPSLRRSLVAFTARLLDDLSPDEAAAIFAHEVAHLEQHDARRLRRARRVSYLLTALGAGVVAALLRWAPGYAPLAAPIFPFVVLLALARRHATVQRHETESDLRAVALTGDAATVARALTRIHQAARLPRRWPQDFERRATHPSLARRIQAIHSARTAARPSDLNDTTPSASMQASRVSPALPVVLRSGVPGRLVVLDHSRAYWLEGVSDAEPIDARDLVALRERATSYRAAAYGDLVELRVAATGNRRALVAADRNGARWEVPLADAQAADAQRALDLVDVRLGAPVRRHGDAIVRVLAICAICVAPVAHATVVLVPALVALWRPSVAALAAVGAMSLGAAALVALGAGGHPLGASALTWIPLAMLIALGASAAYRSWRGRSELSTATWHQRPTLLLVALCATAAFLLAGNATAMAYGATPGESGVHSLSLVLLGLGAALATLPERTRRGAGALAGVTALGLGVLDVTRATPAPAASTVRWSEARATLTASVPLDAMAYGLELSPGGKRYVVRLRQLAPASAVVAGAPTDPDESDDADDSDDAPGPMRAGERQRFAVGPLAAGGPEAASSARREVRGLDATFLDDEHLLILDRRAGGLELRLEDAADTARARWRVALPALALPVLVVDRAEGAWSVMGNGGARILTVASGSVGAPGVTLTRHIAPAGGIPVAAFHDGSAVAMTFAAPGLSGRPWTLQLLAMLFARPRLRASLWHLGRETRAVGGVDGMPLCAHAEVAGAASCILTTIEGTRLIAIGRSGAVTELGTLPERSFARGPGRGGMIAARPVGDDARVLLVDPHAAHGVRVTLPADPRAAVTDVQGAPGVIATLSNGVDGARLGVYRVE